MKIIAAERRRKKFAAILLWNGNMKKRMLSFDKHSHISTIRVKFQWTKHIRQLKPKPMKEISKKSTRIILFWRNQRLPIAHHKGNLIWIDDEMKTKGTQGQFIIDRRTIALDTDGLFFESRCYWKSRKGKHEFWNENMENELLKKGTFGNVMLGRWMNQTIKSYTYTRRIYWENQALTNQLINQTGTFGPVMLRRMKKID